MERVGPHVGDLHQPDLARTPDHDAPFPLLGRLDRDDLRYRLRRAGKCGELAVEDAEGPRRVEVADQDRFRVVRPEEVLVVLAQLLGGDPLDVGAVSDGIPVIGMRQDGGPDDRLVQRDRGVVLADLVFVPDDRHLGLPLLVQNQRPAKPVGLDPHRQLQLVGRQCRVAVHPVVPRGHVGGAVVAACLVEHFLKRLVSVGAPEILGALVEEKVLEEVRGACVPGRLVPRSDVVHDLERDHRRRGIPREQDRHAVRPKAVLRDAAEGIHPFHVRRNPFPRLLLRSPPHAFARRRGGGGDRERQRQREEEGASQSAGKGSGRHGRSSFHAGVTRSGTGKW